MAHALMKITLPHIITDNLGLGVHRKQCFKVLDLCYQWAIPMLKLSLRNWVRGQEQEKGSEGIAFFFLESICIYTFVLFQKC